MHISGLLIFREKKSKILRDFQGQIRGKIGQFRGIFVGKKSKSQKNRPISRDFSGKKSNFKVFSEANLRKIGRFHGKFWGETSPRNYQQKAADFAGFFWQISRKSINFVSISVV